MAKIKKQEPLEDKGITPEGTFHIRLTKCIDKIKPVTFGGKTEDKPRFIWVFDVIERRERQGNKFVWVNCQTEELVCIKQTGQEYGYVDAALTAFLDDMLPGEAARFMDAVADTEELLGWYGETTVKHETVGDKTYANLTAIKPDEDWFIKFLDTKMGGELDPFGDANKAPEP